MLHCLGIGKKIQSSYAFVHHMQKQQIILFYVFILSAFLCFDLSATLHDAIELHAEAAILMNAESGKVLFEKNSRDVRYPASITKIATALYTLKMKEGDLDQMIIADQDAIGAISSAAKKRAQYRTPPHWLEIGSSHVGIKSGEQMSLRDLLYGMMLMSGNDAANVIAQYVGGTIPEFVERLNVYLKDLGCCDTHFVNPNGLHHPNHVTTAYDMALITQEAMKHPIFRQIVRTVQYTRPQTNKQAPSPWIQMNKLLRQGPYFYPQAIGVKTGYTSDAKQTLVGAAEKNGRMLISVILGCAKANEKFADSITLFNIAFEESLVQRTFVDASQRIFSCHLPNASHSLSAVLKENIAISYYPSEQPKMKAQLQWHVLTLPILAGQHVGDVQMIDVDRQTVAATYALYALEKVEPDFSTQCKHKLLFFVQLPLWQKVSMAIAICTLVAALLVYRSRR